MSKEKTAHEVLARKYRPRGFEELVGQPGVSQTLVNALTARRMHHAYLFTGPRGCGKTTTARILAKALNCAKGPTPAPCDECVSCREIALSSSLDVLEMDAASHTGVDNVREAIIETVALVPTRDRYKIFIIDETHMLSMQAFNALLKTIEEPPPHVVFILATTEAHKVPATIASRCQRFKFRPVAGDLLAGHLAAIAKKENVAVEPEALDLLARAAEGSLRDAVSLLDQCRSAGGRREESGRITLDIVREMFGFVSQDLLLGVARALLARDAKALAGWLKKIYEEGVEPAQLLKDLRAGIDGVYLEKLGAAEPAGRWDAADPAWTKALGAATADGLGFLLRRLNRAIEELRFGDSPRLALELGLFSAIEAAHDLGAWVARLEALEKRLSDRAMGEAALPTDAPGGTISWSALIEAVSEEKIGLGVALEKARGEANAGGGYRIRFSKSFDLESAKRSSALIEAALARLAGRPVPLELALGAHEPAGPTEIVDPDVPATSTAAAAPPGTRWKDVSESAGGSAAGGLKSAEGVFGGKARIVAPIPKTKQP